MLILRIKDEVKEKERIIKLGLVRLASGNILLRAYDNNDESIPQGSILQINVEGTLTTFADPNPKYFQVDARGKIKITDDLRGEPNRMSTEL